MVFNEGRFWRDESVDLVGRCNERGVVRVCGQDRGSKENHASSRRVGDLYGESGISGFRGIEGRAGEGS